PAGLTLGDPAPGGNGSLAHLPGKAAQLTGHRPLQPDQAFPDRIEAAPGLGVLDIGGLSRLAWSLSATHDSQCCAPGRVTATGTPGAGPAAAGDTVGGWTSCWVTARWMGCAAAAAGR